ncbi:MAG: SecD/SecF fusion protein [Thermoleophilaceae bacterium]|nr:SecD/SecF fusion protein [Thermoleophilaceae bacterium]
MYPSWGTAKPPSIRGVGRLLTIAFAVAVAVFVAGCGGGGEKHAVACAPKPLTHYVIYRARGRDGAAVTPTTLDATVKALCDRARAAGATGVAVRRIGAGQIEIGGPKPPSGALGAPARLVFYDWEPNLLPAAQSRPTVSLFKAVQIASRQKPRAEAVDLPSDRANDATGRKYYVFGPDRKPLGSAPNAADAFYASCPEIAAAFHGPGTCGASRGSTVVEVPRGIVVLKDESRPPQQAGIGYWILEDDAELTGADIKDPQQQFDPQTNEPIVIFDFTGKGRMAFARTTRREALRGARIPRPPGTPIVDTFQKFAIALDNQLVSLATIDYQQNPQGIPGDTGAQLNGLGDIQQTQELARNLGSRPLPLDLVRVSTR